MERDQCSGGPLRNSPLAILFFLSCGLVSAGDLVVTKTASPIAPPPQLAYQATHTLSVYALPGFQLIASNPEISGLTAVSEDGRRLYEYDLSLHQLRTYELPGLHLIRSVAATGVMPWIGDHATIIEHPRRPGVVIIKGVYWIDARSGLWIETPTSLRVPLPLPFGTSVHISAERTKLLITYYPDSPHVTPPGHKVIDLDNPRQIQTLPTEYGDVIWMERIGLVGSDRDRTQLEIRDLQTQDLLRVIPPPPGLHFGSYTAMSADQLLCVAWTEAEDEKVLLRLDLPSGTYQEIWREQVTDDAPWGWLVERRGDRVLLAIATEPPAFPLTPYSKGMMREIDLVTGASTLLEWPQGGGPLGNGSKLAAAGAVPQIPISAQALAVLAFLLLLCGVHGYRTNSRRGPQWFSTQ